MSEPVRQAPTEADLRHIARHVLGAALRRWSRFTTGNHHFVYEVHPEDGPPVVIRIAYVEEKAAIDGALVWSALLRPRGVPLPRIIHAETDCTTCPFPFMVLDRVPGTDLGHVYGRLDTAQRQQIVAQLVRIQMIAGSLPEGAGFGYVGAPAGSYPFGDWGAVLGAAVARTQTRLADAGHHDLAWMERLERGFASLRPYFESVRPTPFLHDMTSKNVLVADGRLSGIVDVDSLCYGDPLYLPGLIGAAFIADGLDRNYVGQWKDALGLDPFQCRIVDFYSAQCLAYIIGEIGLPMNQTGDDAPDAAGLQRLTGALAGLLG